MGPPPSPPVGPPTGRNPPTIGPRQKYQRAGIDTAAPESTHFAAGIRQAQDLLQALTDQLAAQEAMYVPAINQLSLLTPPTVAPRPPELRRKPQPILLLERLSLNR